MSPCSAIPHLARAIVEKQKSRLWQLAQSRSLAPRLRSQSSTSKSKSTRVPSTLPPTLRSSPRTTNPAVNDKVTPSSTVGQQGRSLSAFLVVTATFASLTGLYSAYLYVNWTNSVTNHAHSDNYLPFNADVSSRWKELGRDFDDEVEMSEKLMFMRTKRRRLVRHAYGNVLEVSVGTGRNLDFYDLRGFDPTNASLRNIITHLTLNDQSDVIIAAAEEKLENIMSRQEKSPKAKVDFVIGDAGVSGIIQRPEGGYDTIVQTMGVCSMVDPVGFLRRMGQLCRQPGEKSTTPERWRLKEDDGKGGQILLLEHGRGYFDWLNWVLDTGASLHAHRFGCWWNKDIEQIVEQSGLEIEQIKRYHGGTTWMIVLRPKAHQDSVERTSRVDNLQVIPQRQFGSSGQK